MHSGTHKDTLILMIQVDLQEVLLLQVVKAALPAVVKVNKVAAAVVIAVGKKEVFYHKFLER